MTSTRKSGQFLAVLAHDVEAELATIQLANSEQAVPQSRQFLQEELLGWGFSRKDELTDRVLLVASELVTNSVLHGRTRPADETETLGLSLSVKPGAALGILVTDNSPKVPAPVFRPDTADGGRGLRLVSAIADHWTAAPATRDGEVVGKGVWAFFRWPGEAEVPARKPEVASIGCTAAEAR
ncbi:ATP-binding protein [Streptomyces sp. NRRL B-24572]|uniref:ATP-binding protein n=1 Tax=Streptomyces sp. NRRL B-24572 TaxID=1962156 RepID=UPI000A391326|nr:ATP-binding protein [Streptomyces sp. NRRL B-24572]